MITPTFGAILKGYRIGFFWSREHQCFIRLSDAGSLFRMELAPGDQGARGLPSKSFSKEHRRWKDNPALLDEIEPLKQIKAVRRHTVIYLDEQGRSVSK